MLPVDGNGNLVFDGMGDSAASAANKLWLPLLEKAYVQWCETGHEWRVTGGTPANAYAAIAGGWMSDVNCQVLGHTSTDYGLWQADGMQAMIAALAANDAVTIATNQSTNSGDTLNYGLFGSHAYAVSGYIAGNNGSAGTFTLYNPWGFDQPSGPLTWAQLTSNCGDFSVTNPSGTSPISAPAASSLAAVGQLMAHVPSPMAFDAVFAASNNGNNW